MAKLPSHQRHSSTTPSPTRRRRRFAAALVVLAAGTTAAAAPAAADTTRPASGGAALSAARKPAPTPRPTPGKTPAPRPSAVRTPPTTPCGLDLAQVTEGSVHTYRVEGSATRRTTVTAGPGYSHSVPLTSILRATSFDEHANIDGSIDTSIGLVLRDGQRLGLARSVGGLFPSGDHVIRGSRVDTSVVDEASGHAAYELLRNGRLRRTVGARPTQTVRGLPVRTITLVSHRPTYDLLLGAAKDGRLLTIRIPTTTAFTPTVTTIRKTGWGHVDRLIAERCTDTSTVIAGFEESGTAHLYWVGDARAARSTPIVDYGKIPG